MRRRRHEVDDEIDEISGVGRSQQSRDDQHRQGDRSFDDSDQSEDTYNEDILDVR